MDENNKTKWEVLDFIEDSDFGVEVKKLPMKIPAYSVDVLARKREAKLSCHLQVRVIRDGHEIEVDRISQRIEALIRTAEDLILRDAKAAAAKLLKR